MEPRSLLDENPTGLESALLRAGRADGPRKEATAHLLAVMQALPPASGQPLSAHSVESGLGHAAAAASVKPAGLARWVKLGLLAAAVGGGTTYLARMSGDAPAPVPALQEPVSAPVEVLGAGQAEGAPEVREGLAPAHGEERPQPAVENRPRRQRAGASARPREATPEASDSPLDRSLGNETRDLDRAREALDAHRSSEALRVLDDYQRSYPRGRLRPESMVLRVAALVQAGKRGAADALANQLLADEVYQTYAPRIRSLLGETKP